MEFKGTYTQKKLCTHPNMNMRHVLNVNSNSLFKYGRYSDAVTMSMRRCCAEANLIPATTHSRLLRKTAILNTLRGSFS